MTRPVFHLIAIVSLAAACAVPAAAQEGLFTEIRFAVDRSGLKDRRVSVETRGLERVLRERLRILSPERGTVEIRDVDEIRVRVPAEGLTDEQLRLFGRPGVLELRHLEDVQTTLNPKGRYLLDVLNVQGRVSLRFRDRRDNGLVPAAEFLKECPLIADGREMIPGSAKVVTEGFVPVIRVLFDEEGTKRLERFSRKPGRMLAVVLDGEIISINATNVLVEPVRRKKREKSAPKQEESAPAPAEEERRFGQVDIGGGFRTEAEARHLAALLNSGELPFPLAAVSRKLVGQ